MTLTNEMKSIARTIANELTYVSITKKVINRLKEKTNAVRVEMDDYFNKVYFVYDNWVVVAEPDETFGEEIGTVRVLDIEGDEPEEIYKV